MTALRDRRRRSTIIAFVAAVVGIAAAAILGITGVRSLADSTAGEQAAGQADALPSQRLPFTSTALVGVVDEDDRLTSAAVWVLEPDGVGGSIVALAATADAASGTLDTLAPLAAVYRVDGPDAFREAAERLTGLSFDVAEVVDQARFARLIGPLGDVPVLFPFGFADASSDDAWEAGDVVLSAPAMARALTATDPASADWAFEPARAAVWSAVSDRVGAGIGSAEPVASDQDVPTPRTLDEFAERLFGASVQFRALSFVPIDDARVEAEIEPRFVGVLDEADAVVAHDRAEMVILLGAIAPGRLGAPLDAPVFRVVSPFSDDDLAGLGLNSSDVLKRAIDRLFFAQANVVSVADLASVGVPERTRVEVADPGVLDAVTSTYEPLFGDIDVVPASVRVDGVDIVVTLGATFLDEVRDESGADVAGSDGDAASDPEEG